MSYILALDQGTSSSRALLINRAGCVISNVQHELNCYFPSPGWVEQHAEEIWKSQVTAAAETIARSGASPTDIKGIGITNQRETTILWERASGTPIYPAIVWQDRRTAALCEALKCDGLESRIRERTGLLLDPYFSATKIRWILDSVPNARAQAERGELAFGTVDSWLLWKMTGGRIHATDASNASRTLLYNIHDSTWDSELLELLNVPATILPEIRESSCLYGVTNCKELPSGIPISGIAGDQQSALFGQACTRPGMVKNTYGTGCFMLMNVGTKPVNSQNGLLSTVAWQMNGKTEYALEGSVFSAGAAVQWLKDGLGIIRSAHEVTELAASVTNTGGVYLVPAFVGLGAPHWDPLARGAILGITRGTTAAHIARATLESIAHQVTDVLNAMETDADINLHELRVDGGVAANNLLLQFQSDLLGIPVVRPKLREITALGAAYLAGLALSFWSSTEEIASLWQSDVTFLPHMETSEVHSQRVGWRKALHRAKDWVEA